MDEAAAGPLRECLRGLRETNSDSLLGLKTVIVSDGAATPAGLDEFLGYCRKYFEASGAHDRFRATSGCERVALSDVKWSRHSFTMYPAYVERLLLVEGLAFPAELGKAPLLFACKGNGEWLLAKEVVDPAHALFYKKHLAAWEAYFAGLLKAEHPAKHSGGFFFNYLEISKESLRQGDVDVRPLVLHAIAPDGRACDRGDVASQTAIANAFWQTFWATGATRTERGSTFPVAFLPIDRASKFEFAPPFRELYISLRRRLFGRTSILSHVVEKLTAEKALVFDTESRVFCVASAFRPETCELLAQDVLLAIRELNRTAFVDAYTGDNKSLFSAWPEHESRNAAKPWPYDSPGSDSPTTIKIKAGGPAEDFLAEVRATPTAAVVRIHRVVPYAGCAFLYECVSGINELIARGKVQDFDGEILAATNSTFFLNFPEEYATLHSAMNDPVALLVENGKTHQLKTLRRASFLISSEGDTLITTRASNQLNSDMLLFEGESASATYFRNADKSYTENQVGPLFFGAVVTGNSIVETFEETSTEVPSNGWVTGDSEAFGGAVVPENAVSAIMRDGTSQFGSIRHGFAVGPLLVEHGKAVPLGESKEEFQGIVLRKPPSFDASKDLTRTQLAPEIMHCDKRGAPPTRFPYDWDFTRAPRTAIGVKADGAVVLVVVDGRADMPHAVGATLAELAQLMINLQCVTAMNMDGGGSSVMFVSGKEAAEAKLRPHLRDGVVNLPSDLGGTERLLPVPLVIYRRKS